MSDRPRTQFEVVGRLEAMVRDQRKLTVRGVKAMLTREGIDYTGLEFREDDNRVLISGDDSVRRRVRNALLDSGLTLAPYPDCDWWSRP